MKLAYQSSQGEDEEASAEPTKVHNFADISLDHCSSTVGPATKDQKKTKTTKLLVFIVATAKHFNNCTI